MHSSSLIVLIALLFVVFNYANGTPDDIPDLLPSVEESTPFSPPDIWTNLQKKRSVDSKSSEESAGVSAVYKAQELEGKGISAVENAGNSVESSAKQSTN